MNEFNTDDFDEELESSGSAGKEDFGALLNESFGKTSKRLKVGDKITGKLLNTDSQEVFVTTGMIHDGVLQRAELLDAEGNLQFKAGDTIEVFVTLVKGDEIRLSRKASGQQVANDLQEAFANNQPVQGRIVEVVKGGVRVNIKGKLAFCPISQIDAVHVENPADYVGKSFEFKVTELKEGGRNIVVSRRKLLDVEREASQGHFLSEHKDGDIVTGRVTRFEAFGAFVELAPGLDGLVHISEISWSRVSAPADVLNLGDTVTVKLIKREVLNGRAKISLSIKQVTPKEDKEVAESKPAQENSASKYQVGQTFTGKVVRKEPYGVFVELEPRVNGLLHKSRYETNHGFHAEKLRVNDPLEVQIVEIKGGTQISLALPGDQAQEDWKTEYKPQAGSMGTLAGAMAAALAKKK